MAGYTDHGERVLGNEESGFDQNFSVVKKVPIETLQIDDVIRYDNIITSNGELILLKNKTSETTFNIDASIYCLAERNHEILLDKTTLVKENMVDATENVAKISLAVDDFFNNLDVYKEFKTFPKRGVLLYGPPGCGKSSTMSLVLDKYQEGTAVLIWPTNIITSNTVKYILTRAKYTEKVKRLVFIIEDIGGSNERTRDNVSSDMLALLDDKESIYKVPTLIVATTNYPEKFMESLVNRPGRFDDKIEVSYPKAATRVKILEHFIPLTDEDREEFGQSKYNKFTAAHVKEAALKHKLKKISPIASMQIMLEEIKLYEKSFTKKKEIGIGFDIEE